MVHSLTFAICFVGNDAIGETGDWKRHFSPELNRRLDEWIEVNLRDTGLSFVEEL